MTAINSSTSEILFSQLFIGPWLEDPFKPEDERSIAWIEFSSQFVNRNISLVLKKITTAEPYGSGLGSRFFRPSIFHFFGIGTPEGEIEVIEPVVLEKRKIVAVGASDTAGYCVDGNPEIKGAKLILRGWEYVNCGLSYPTVLGTLLDAHVDVHGISGVGLTQNAKAREQWQLGKLTMPSYFNRTPQY